MKNSILPLYPGRDIILSESKGCYYFDSEGKQYLDLEAGVWAANLGHSHPQINSVIRKQIDKNIHQGYIFRNEASEELADVLNIHFDFKNGQSVFLSSGSEAVNLAISLALHISGKQKILKIDNTYLSAYGYGKNSDENLSKIDITSDTLDELEHIDCNEIGAVMLELGGASIDVVQFPKQFFVEKLIKKARQHNCIIIIDEVTTGMARTGKMFGYQHYDIIPDMVVLGKGLGNGYPISSVTVHEDIALAFKDNPFIYGQSHQNDALGCAIALEVFKIIVSEKICPEVEEKGNYFKSKLLTIQSEFRQIKDIRGRGLLMAVEFSDSSYAKDLHQRLFDKGYVFTCKKGCFRFLPPLIIDKKQINDFINDFQKALY